MWLGLTACFVRNAAGNVVITFALCSVPAVGAMGVALDYTRLADMRTALQAQADAEALGAYNGEWLDDTRYRVVKESTLETTLMPILGVDSVDVTVTAIAYHALPELVYKSPAYMFLDGDAMDYNRMGVYCYNSSTNTRSDIIIIADNRGHPYSDPIPQCGHGETFELALHNVWYDEANITDPSLQRYYKTDSGVPPWQNANQSNVLETFLCDTYEECRPVSMGGTVPEGPDRLPNIEARPCEPGKFMYYGWEDTPEAFGDADFNDIRIVFECPEQSSAKRMVRLVK